MLALILLLFIAANGQNLDVGVISETDLAKVIIVSEPSIERTHQLLDLRRPLENVFEGIEQHKKMQDALKSLGATVIKVKDVLLNGTDDRNGEDYQILFNFTLKSAAYDFSNLKAELECLKNLKGLNKKQRQSLKLQLEKMESTVLTEKYQNDYGKRILRNASAESLAAILLTRPTVEFHFKNWFIGNRAFVIVYSKMVLKPLNDVIFFRDQQITTKNGIVILRSKKRSGEHEISEFVLRKLGVKLLGKVSQGYAEGGEFIPNGNIAFIGQGLRTSMEAIGEMMSNDWFGYDEIAVVCDYSDFNEDRLHLDTFFNFLKPKHVLILDETLTKTEWKRYVDLYSKKHDNNRNDKKFDPYTRIARRVEFGEFLQQRNYTITTVTNAEQMKFATNFLNIGNQTIVTAYCQQDYVQKLEDIGITVICVDISDLTIDNCAVHCMTQVVKRD